MRCFVAIDPSAGARAAIAEVQRRVRANAGAADVRWVDPEVIHLTLKFLGEVAEARVPAVAETLRVVAAPVAPLALALGGLGAFPTVRRARVVWIGVTAGAAEVARLAGGVDQALAAVGFVPEARPWSAHLTVGRVRSPRGMGHLAAAIEGAPRAEIGAWTVREMVLYRSHLRPTGAVYEAVARLPLAGADA
jgi:RNA 2',3'-cyclic 3'-phosphodiesterase